MAFSFRVLLDSLPTLLFGAITTIQLVLLSLAISIVLGGVVCAGRVLGRGLVRSLSIAYVSLFRTLPETVLIFWLFYCIPLLFHSKPTAMQSAIVALAIPAGAYMAEIFRAGIDAIPSGQLEAAKALGLSPLSIVYDIIAPQALRTMAPPILGLVTILIKNSALVSVIGVEELFYHATVQASQNYRYFELLTAAALLYFAMILPLSIAVQWQERRLITRSH